MRQSFRRLLKGTSIYTLGALSPKAIGLVLIPVYARYLSEGEYGMLALLTTIHSVLYILMEMGLGHAVLRFYFDLREDPRRLKDYLGTIQLFLFGANLGVLALLFVFGEPLFRFLIKDPALSFRPFIWLGVLTTYFALGSIVPLELYRCREQAGRYVLLQVAYTALVPAAVIVAVVLQRRGVLGAVQARLGVTVGFCALYWLLLLREIRPRLVRADLRASLAYGLPLVPMAVANWVLTFSDRAILERFLTLKDVGIYAMGYTVGMVMGDLVRSVNKAYVPFFFDTAKTDKSAPRILADIGLVYMVAISAVALVGVLFAREGLLLLATEKYAASVRIVPFVIGAYLLRGMQYMAANQLYFVRRTKVLSLSVVVAAAANVGLNLWWVPRLGILGAAYSTVVAYALATALVVAVAQRHYPLPYDRARIGAVLLLFTVGAAGGTLPRWEGYLVPVLCKLAVIAAFAAGLHLFGVVRFRDWARVLGPGRWMKRG